MTISKELFLSILSMDAYNQGYGANVEHGKTQIGSASVEDLPSGFDDSVWQDAGFYAVSYTVAAGAWEGLDDSATVISYRGTDFPLDDGFGNDTDHGWSPALNNAATIHLRHSANIRLIS